MGQVDVIDIEGHDHDEIHGEDLVLDQWRDRDHRLYRRSPVSRRVDLPGPGVNWSGLRPNGRNAIYLVRIGKAADPWLGRFWFS